MVSESDVLKALKKIKSKFTKGPDNVHAFIVKDCSHILARLFRIIFNLSLKSQKFPDVWKFSHLYIVYKKFVVIYTKLPLLFSTFYFLRIFHDFFCVHPAFVSESILFVFVDNCINYIRNIINLHHIFQNFFYRVKYI